MKYETEKYKTEVLLEVLAAALLCGPVISGRTSKPHDPLDEIYERLCDRVAFNSIPFPEDMRRIEFFEWTEDESRMDMRVTEKGLQFLKNGGK